MKNGLEKIKEQIKGFDTKDLLAFALKYFGDKIALASSFSAEDMVITDMLCKVTASPKIFTLDTGRLPQETFDIIEGTRKKYGIEIEILFPDFKDVEKMTTEHGPNLFYESVPNRRQCCYVRKVKPLNRKLAELDAWISGLRKEQSVTRQDLQRVEKDETNNLVKINPLADWTENEVWNYIRHNDVPYNKLHDKGYPSIGCRPCTRAVKTGEDIRSGRWWWEEPEHKECGLHIKD